MARRREELKKWYALRREEESIWRAANKEQAAELDLFLSGKTPAIDYSQINCGDNVATRAAFRPPCSLIWPSMCRTWSSLRPT